MKPMALFPREMCRRIRYVLTDIDDTLTTDGRLPACSLAAMERLAGADIHVVPITGRPAGWCDHMARMWPIDGIVGENGAFYFRYDPVARKVHRRYWRNERQRATDRHALEEVCKTVLESVPGCAVASDQAYREADLAIDFCEDVAPLPPHAVDAIVACFTAAGAQAKISSIHVNGWFGRYDKLAMTRRFFEEVYHKAVGAEQRAILFVGDSPNDAPMFRFFEHSIGVANVQDFSGRMPHPPRWITRARGGEGFAEMVDTLLEGCR